MTDDRIEALRARARATIEKHRNAHRWLDAPAHDGPWWRIHCEDTTPSLVMVRGVDDAEGDGQLRVYFFGVDGAEYIDAPGEPSRVEDYRWHAAAAPTLDAATPQAPDHAERVAEIAALLDADDAAGDECDAQTEGRANADASR